MDKEEVRAILREEQGVIRQRLLDFGIPLRVVARYVGSVSLLLGECGRAIMDQDADQLRKLSKMIELTLVSQIGWRFYDGEFVYKGERWQYSHKAVNCHFLKNMKTDERRAIKHWQMEQIAEGIESVPNCLSRFVQIASVD